MKKISVLTMALAISVFSYQGKAEYKEHIDEFKKATAVAHDSISSHDALLKSCKTMEAINKKTYSCDSLDKKRLVSALFESDEDFGRRLRSEENNEVKKVYKDRMDEVKVAYDTSVVFADYARICEKIKDVKEKYQDKYDLHFSNCTIDKISDCYEVESVEDLKGPINKCIEVYNASTVSTKCSDYLKFNNEKTDQTISLDVSFGSNSLGEIKLEKLTSGKYSGQYDLSAVGSQVSPMYSHFLNLLKEETANNNQDYRTVQHELTENWFKNCIYEQAK